MKNPFPERLKQIIKENDLAVAEVAKAIDVSPKTIYAFMSGDRGPAFDRLVKLADYLNVSTDYLLGKSDEPTAILVEEGEEGIKGEVLYIRRAYKNLSSKERKIIINLIKSLEDDDDKD